MTDQPDPSPVLIRAARAEDDLDAHVDLAERSFGPQGPAERDRWRQWLAGVIAQDRCLSAFADGRLAGGSPEQDAALDAAFAGTAYMLDAF